MTSSDGKYEVAFVTDVGQLKDKSFNQGTWNGVKLYASQNDKSYKYYQPANGNQATDDDRFEAMKAAVDGGANVVVCAGFLQEAALTKAAIAYPDVDFVFVDGYALNGEDGQLSGQRRWCLRRRRAGRLLRRLRCRYGRLHQAGLLRRRWRHQSCLLPLWLWLRPGRQRGALPRKRQRRDELLLGVRLRLRRFP
ncbi:MAG: BMP family lipoprotein [Evtepia sp.]